MNPTEGVPPAERRRRATKLCRRLAKDVAAIAPEGIGRWERAWEITDPSSAAFMAALSAWEADPTPAALERVRGAYQTVVDAWGYAAAEFRAREASNHDRGG